MIDSEVKDIMDSAYRQAKKILSDKKEYVEKLVALLIKNEVVSKEEFDALFNE